MLISCAYFVFYISLIWTASSSIFESEEEYEEEADQDNNKGNDDATAQEEVDDSRWWNTDWTSDQYVMLSLVLCLALLVFGSLALSYPITKVWHPKRGEYNRFHLGVLAASLFFMSNLFFITFWYTLDVDNIQSNDWVAGTRYLKDDNNDKNNNKDNNKQNNKNGGDDYTIDYNDDATDYQTQSMLSEYKGVVSLAVTILAVIYFILSAAAFNTGRKLDEKGGVGGGQKSDYMAVISDVWKFLSFTTLAVVVLLLIGVGILSGGEGGSEMRQAGHIYNLFAIISCLILTTLFMIILGQKIDGSFGAGLLEGGTFYFSLILMVICVMYSNPQGLFGEREDQNGYSAGLATSATCFFLSVLYFAFSLLVSKYQKIIATAGGSLIANTHIDSGVGI